MRRSEWDIHPKHHQCHLKCEISSKWHPLPSCIRKPILFTAQGSPLSRFILLFPLCPSGVVEASRGWKCIRDDAKARVLRV